VNPIQLLQKRSCFTSLATGSRIFTAVAGWLNSTSDRSNAHWAWTSYERKRQRWCGRLPLKCRKNLKRCYPPYVCLRSGAGSMAV
jgi:hypothetical protein